jgi:pyruvate-formate lyase-activating enzyme
MSDEVRLPRFTAEMPIRGGEMPSGCTMVDSIYVKANGELPCWCFVGEYHVLDRLHLEDLRETDATVLGLPMMERIREFFDNGEMPFPVLCAACYALGTRKIADRRPEVLEQLMIEPSYLCKLDCPECLGPEERLYYKAKPYTMDLEFFRAFLDCLRADGIERVGFAHFEGRGDPLMNPELGDMLRLIKEVFPGVRTQVTTHGNYRFRPYLLAGDLDILRLSINGATPEIYERYQRGGSLESVLNLLREIRAHRRLTGSRLVVEWKYILFEWNDSDDEIRHAAELAEELEARLLFVMTNTRGLSRRFSSPLEWYQRLSELAPRARLTDLDDAFTLQTMETERRRLEKHVERPLAKAYERSRRGWSWRADRHLRRSLGAAGCRLGKRPRRTYFPVEDLPRILGTVTASHLIEALAEIALANHEWAVAEQLFRTFLRLQPETERRRAVEAHLTNLVLLSRLGTAEPEGFVGLPDDDLEDAERALLGVHPGYHPGGGPPAPDDDPSGWIEFVDDCRALILLGGLRRARGDLDAATAIFERALAISGDKDEAPGVRRILNEIDSERRT